MADRPIEAVVVLTHDVLAAGKRKPCGRVAMHATEGWLRALAARDGVFVCNGCRAPVTLDDVTGDEPYVPSYRPPNGGSS